MGLTNYHDIVFPTESEERDMMRDFDKDGNDPDGYWRQFVFNEHVRTIIEKIVPYHYCFRSLIRSALFFETIEEMLDAELWKGRLYFKHIEKDILNRIGTTEDLGETGFRARYRELGGKGNW